MRNYGWLPATVWKMAAGSPDANKATSLRHVAPQSDTARPVPLCPLRCPTKNLPLTTLLSPIGCGGVRYVEQTVKKFGNKVCVLRCDAVYRNQKVTSVYKLLPNGLQCFRWYFGTFPPRCIVIAIQTTVTCSLN